jgi:putative ABC transport system permease protein
MRPAVASQLYGIGALDPRIFALVPLLFLAVSGLACFFPARRASQIDPATMLRLD